jgi:hypothetical protein
MSARSPEATFWALNVQLLVAAALGAAGMLFAGLAIVNERRMHRHRQPGVTYAAATLRRDGGWRRTDLFTEEGLRYQARASGFGIVAVASWLLALVALVVLAGRP